jgi:hypothetical protein
MRALVIAIVLLHGTAQAGVPKGKGYPYYFEEGMKRFNLGDYAEAVDFFKQGYLAKPDPVFLFNLGQCHRMMGDLTTAAREYRSYLRAVPDAENRIAVERFLADSEEELKRRAAAVPPTGAMQLPASSEPPARTREPPPAKSEPPPPPVEEIRPKVDEPKPAAPVAAPVPTPAPAAAPSEGRGRVGVILAVVIVAVILVAGASVGIGLAAAPHDAMAPSTTSGVFDVTFGGGR